MATNNKWAVERTNVLRSNKALAATYDYLDEGDFGWYAVAGETYEFDATIVYSVTAITEGVAFSINSSGTIAADLTTNFISEYNTNATTVVRTACTAFNTPDHGSDSPVAFPSGLNIARVYGVVKVDTDGFIGVTGIAENTLQASASGGKCVLKWRRVSWPADA